MPGNGDLDDLLRQYDNPVKSWPGEESLDEEARANLGASRAPPRERPDEAYRGVVLPFRETTSGAHEWAVPGIVQGPVDAARAMAHGLYNSPFFGPAVRPSEMPEHVSQQMADSAVEGTGAALLGTSIPGAIAGMPRGQVNAFMVPEQMGRLQDAGRVKPGARGSREALAAAEAEWAKGNLDTWAETGWAHKSAFGDRGLTPIAWHDTSDFRLNPVYEATFRERFDPAAATHPTVRDKPFPQVFHGQGVDDILAAEPRMANLPTTVGMRPAYPQGGVRMHNELGNLTHPTGMEAFGPTIDGLLQTAMHEVKGHAVPQFGNAISVRSNNVFGTPVSGTRAHERLNKIVADLRQKALRARDEDATKAAPLLDSLEAADELLYGLDQTAGYYAAPHERMAREAMMRDLDKSLAMVPPGKVDVYADNAWPGGMPHMRFYDKYGIPLRDFAPPGSPFERKD